MPLLQLPDLSHKYHLSCNSVENDLLNKPIVSFLFYLRKEKQCISNIKSSSINDTIKFETLP